MIIAPIFTLMKKIKLLFFVCAFMYLPLQSMAWGLLGHRIVGEIAELYLTGKARKKVAEILGDSSIALQSNWADFIKSNHDYDYLYNWHFTNLKDGFTKESLQEYLQNDTSVDAYTKLNFLVAQLKQKDLAADETLLYLRLLIHIVGDVHQPMHLGHYDDKGGNQVSVYWFKEQSNLHRVWDEQLLEYQQLSYTEYVAAINHPTKAQVKAWQQQPVTDWLYESYEISRSLYAEITQPDQKLSYRYNYDHIAQANEELLKGGIRLAGLLNEIFD